MEKFEIFFMTFAARLSGRKYRKSKGKACDICGNKFANIEEMEKHRRDIHPDMPPREVGR
ncbi:MAG: hypothetical protein M3115_06495 [Thermoproteota archaeon]|nr:hypothetical protein [Thermoproteota archaeon]